MSQEIIMIYINITNNFELIYNYFFQLDPVNYLSTLAYIYLGYDAKCY